MSTFIVIWLVIGLIVWGSAICDDIMKRQDKMIKWINEAIISKDLPRSKSPLLKEHDYTFIMFVKGFVLTLVLWPVVLNRKLR